MFAGMGTFLIGGIAATIFAPLLLTPVIVAGGVMTLVGLTGALVTAIAQETKVDSYGVHD